MAHIKNKKTALSFGSGESTDLATAITTADTGFMCLVETMDGLDLTRGTVDDPAVYCDSDDTIKRKNTEELEVSNFTVEGYCDDDAAKGYIAVQALALTMIKADTIGTMVIVEPNGTDKWWFHMKFINVGKLRGGAQDRQRFRFECIPLTLPLAA